MPSKDKTDSTDSTDPMTTDPEPEPEDATPLYEAEAPVSASGTEEPSLRAEDDEEATRRAFLEAQAAAKHPRALPVTMIPARYRGEHTVILKGGVRAYKGGDGKPLKPHRRWNPMKGIFERVLLLEPGDVLLMPETEVRGQTFLIDATGARPPLWLGAGWSPLPQHAGASYQELAGQRFLGPDGVQRFYQTHEGRPDFEAVTPAAGKAPPAGAPPADALAEEVAALAADEEDSDTGQE